MSHSQFHRTKWFILGHAWLNLLDKHMTTGRINQVAVFSGQQHTTTATTTRHAAAATTRDRARTIPSFSRRRRPSHGYSMDKVDAVHRWLWPVAIETGAVDART